MCIVSGQIKDPSGNLYSNASVFASFVGQNTTPGAGPYLVGGLPSGVFETIITAEADSSANFSMVINGNDTILPTPSQWVFAVLSRDGTTSFSVLITITGATQNITSALQAAAAPLSAVSLNQFVKTLNNVQYADQFPGSDAGAKINSAIAALPATGGIVDARGFQGAQSAAATIDLSGKPIKLLVGAMSLSVNGSPGIKVGSGSDIAGCGSESIITQGTLGNDVIGGVTTGNDIRIHDLSFVGIAGSVAVSVNNGIFISNTVAGNINRVWIYNCDFTGFRYNAIYLQNVSEAVVENNTIHDVSLGIRFSGCLKVKCSGNALRDTQLPASTFSVAIGLDSTDPINGVAYPICDRVVIAHNRVSGYPNAQSILIHAGTNITVVGNVLTDVLIGITCNPFNGTDTLHDVAITGNVYVGTNTVGASGGSGNHGIAVAGGGVGIFTPFNVILANNDISNSNAILKSDLDGGIYIGASDKVTIIGNTIASCFGIGVCITGSVAGATRLKINDNNICDVIANPSTEQVGIYHIGGVAATGIIENNQIDNALQAMRFDISCPNLFIGPQQITNVTERIHSMGNVTVSSTFDGFISLVESAAPNGIASRALIWGDSTSHRPKTNPNNSGAKTLAFVEFDTLTSPTINTPTLTSPTSDKITLTAAAPIVAASQVGLGATTATTATAGVNGAVPAQVDSYLIVNVGGTTKKIPLFLN